MMHGQKYNLAISGKARSGKDTSVDYILNMYPENIKLSFASELYRVTGNVQRDCNFEVEKDRELLQFLGEWIRGKNPNYFVECAERKLQKIASNDNSPNILVSDLRYKNEAEMLKRNNFILIRINREDRPRMTPEQENHKSEVDLDDYNDWDYIINNDTTLDDLYEKLDEILDDIRDSI